jgi:cytochrome c-type biogenesis protein CcmH/NrfG
MASQKVESVRPVGVSWRLTRFAITALIVAALVPQAIYTARAAVLMEEAREAAQRREVESAAEHARRAAIVRPADPEPWAFLAELVLSHWMEDAERRDEGERAAARAVFLDPESAILHYTRSRYHHAAGRGVLAHREQRRARLLHPLKPLYRTTSAESKESPR